MADNRKIKSSIEIGDKKFITYASDWDLYEGEISWDDLAIGQQNRIIKEHTSNFETSEDLSSIVMELGVKKRPIVGLGNVLLAISFLFERARLIDDATKWSPGQKAVVTTFLKGSMLGRRLEKLFADEEIDDPTDCSVYEAELERVAGETQYLSMVDFKHDEFQAFARHVLCQVPDDDAVRKFNDGLSTQATDVKEKAAALCLLSSQRITTDADVADFVSDTRIHVTRHFEELKRIGVLNFVSDEDDPYFDPDFSNDNVLFYGYVAWLTETGKALAVTSRVVAETYIEQKTEEIRLRNEKKTKAIADAKLREKELIRQIESQGGVVKDGLYHLNRRVRARIEDDFWLLSDDEKELGDAIGTSKIWVEINRVDLKNRYGLQIKKELAPAKTSISEWGFISIERADQWGQGAKPYTDTRSLSEKIGIESFGDALFVVAFFPAFVADLFVDRISSKANSVIFVVVLVVVMCIGIYSGRGDGPDTLKDWLLLGFSIYLLTAFMTLWKKTSFNSG